MLCVVVLRGSVFIYEGTTLKYVPYSPAFSLKAGCARILVVQLVQLCGGGGWWDMEPHIAFPN